MWVRGHSRSLKVVPFGSLGMIFYSPSIVTMAISLAILEIFSVKEWPNLEIWVWGPSRSLKVGNVPVFITFQKHVFSHITFFVVCTCWAQSSFTYIFLIRVVDWQQCELCSAVLINGELCSWVWVAVWRVSRRSFCHWCCLHSTLWFNQCHG